MRSMYEVYNQFQYMRGKILTVASIPYPSNSMNTFWWFAELVVHVRVISQERW